MDGDGEAQADEHTAGVALDRGIQEVADIGEVNDLVEFGGDLPPVHSQDGAVHEDVFPAGEQGMKPGAHFDQRSHLSPDRDLALVRPEDAVQHFQQCALAGAVGADNPQGVSPLQGKGDVVDRPELVFSQAFGPGGNPDQVAGDVAQAVQEGAAHRLAEFFAGVLDLKQLCGHAARSSR